MYKNEYISQCRHCTLAMHAHKGTCTYFSRDGRVTAVPMQTRFRIHGKFNAFSAVVTCPTRFVDVMGQCRTLLLTVKYLLCATKISQKLSAKSRLRNGNSSGNQ